MDFGYLDYCTTDLQRDLVKALHNGESVRGYARRVGVSHQVIQSRKSTIIQRAAARGYSPELNMHAESVPEGFHLQKSTVHIRDGSLIQRWDRVQQEHAEIERARLQAINDTLAGYKPFPRRRKPTRTNRELLNLYTLADAHIGMYAEAIESGEDYDLQIAEDTIMCAFSAMIDRTPDADWGVLALLGDWQHFDGLIAQTPKHKHPLDASARYHSVCSLSARLAIALCERMLDKHNQVRVVVLQGNHDEASSAWLQIMLRHVWAKNNRITIPNNAAPYMAMLHGKTMLAWHHGHKRTDDSLRDVFAGDLRWREMWGQAHYAYIHTGHAHSNYVVERGGALIERHPTLSARDAYASRAGYYSRRQARAITYHRDGGEHSRITVKA